MDDDIEIHGDPCKHCGADTTYTQPCHTGCDDGWVDGYEEDPLWYDEGDFYACSECRGRGFFHWCIKCGKDQ